MNVLFFIYVAAVLGALGSVVLALLEHKGEVAFWASVTGLYALAAAIEAVK